MGCRGRRGKDRSCHTDLLANDPLVAVSEQAGTVSQAGELIRFGFGPAMLVSNLVFVEQIGHFFGDHVAVVRDGDERNFLAGPGRTGRGVGFGRVFGFLRIAHDRSIHHPARDGVIQMFPARTSLETGASRPCR